jgi:hypothetical protein
MDEGDGLATIALAFFAVVQILAAIIGASSADRVCLDQHTAIWHTTGAPPSVSVNGPGILNSAELFIYLYLRGGRYWTRTSDLVRVKQSRA